MTLLLVWHAVQHQLLWKLIHRRRTLFPQRGGSRAITHTRLHASRCVQVTIATEYGTGLMCSSGTHKGVQALVTTLHSYRQRFKKLYFVSCPVVRYYLCEKFVDYVQINREKPRAEPGSHGGTILPTWQNIFSKHKKPL